MYALAHACFGAALVTVVGTTPVYGAIGGLLPDVDTLLGEVLPLSHRGLTHTPIIALVLAGLLYLITDDLDDSLALGTGYLSHLFIDTFTPAGIMWLFPWRVFMSHDVALASSVDVNMAIAGIGLLAMQWPRVTQTIDHPSLSSPVTRTGMVVAVMAVTAGATVLTGSLDPQGYDQRSIASILENEPQGEKVAITGTVEEIQDPYESGSSTYQRILVGDGSRRILVFCSATNGKSEAGEGDSVTVEGTVSKYNGEIQIETSCIDVEPAD